MFSYIYSSPAYTTPYLVTHQLLAWIYKKKQGYATTTHSFKYLN